MSFDISIGPDTPLGVEVISVSLRNGVSSFRCMSIYNKLWELVGHERGHALVRAFPVADREQPTPDEFGPIEKVPYNSLIRATLEGYFCDYGNEGHLIYGTFLKLIDPYRYEEVAYTDYSRDLITGDYVTINQDLWSTMGPNLGNNRAWFRYNLYPRNRTSNIYMCGGDDTETHLGFEDDREGLRAYLEVKELCEGMGRVWPREINDMLHTYVESGQAEYW